MHFMNEIEIDMAVERLRHRQVQGKAARFLAAFREEVNEHSDGWCHWRAPVKAAERLMGLVQSPIEVSEFQFTSALIPIRSFYTRRGNAAGMKFPEVQ